MSTASTTIPVGSFGIDATSSPNTSALKSAGVKFVCRYGSISNSSTQFKLGSLSEFQTLSAAGIAIVANFEWTGVVGQENGAQDAQVALQQFTSWGMPSGRPIYFSVDEDVTGASVASYFKSIATVLPVSQIGVYGSAQVCQYLKANNLVNWTWQTYAWSNGVWNSNNNLEQYQNDQNVGGESVDYNRSVTLDFGQWYVLGSSTQPYEQNELTGEAVDNAYNADTMLGTIVNMEDTTNILATPARTSGLVPTTNQLVVAIKAIQLDLANIKAKLGIADPDSGASAS